MALNATELTWEVKLPGPGQERHLGRVSTNQAVVLRKRVHAGGAPVFGQQGADPRHRSMPRQRPDKAGRGNVVRHNCGQEVDLRLARTRASSCQRPLEDLPESETPPLARGAGNSAHQTSEGHACLAGFCAETGAGH